MARVAQRTPLMQMTQQMRRSVRTPQHRFNLAVRPWQIQPCMIAPVLPGETMKNLLLQSRIVTKPIKNALIGWWAEYYVFYVKLRDLDARDAWEAMMLNPEADLSAQNVAASVSNYHFHASTPDFTAQCLKRVVEDYFRDEGEAWNNVLIDTKPVASIGQDSWLDSVITQTVENEDDFSVDLDASGTTTAGEVDQALRMYEFLQLNNLATMTFEDYLATYGVKPNPELSHKPELIRYVRSWTYPSNTVEPTTGVPSSACSWSVAERADKDRAFREPGFIFAVQVIRPKVYLNRLRGSAVDVMNSAISWLPSVLSDDPRSSMLAIADNHILGDNTDANGVWLDIKDLFMYGDQYVNFAFAGATSEVALPTVAMQKRYPSATDADNLFTGATAATRLVESDGVVALSIASRLQDSSPTSVSVA